MLSSVKQDQTVTNRTNNNSFAKQSQLMLSTGHL